MNILDLKKLMLVPLACCVLVQQADAKVMYSSGATKDLQNAVNGNDGQSRNNVPNAYVSLDKAESDDPIKEKIKVMVKRMTNYPEYQVTKDDQMPGLAAFIPETKKGTWARVRAYLGCKRKVEQGNIKLVPRNDPKGNDDVQTLCAFNEYTHTERQLAACALFGAGLTNGPVTQSGDIGNMNRYKWEKERKTIRGDLHIYTPAPPCAYVTKNDPDNGGIYCTTYYGLLSRMFPNVRIHVYFETNKLKGLSTEALTRAGLSDLVNKWAWAIGNIAAEKLRDDLKAAQLSNQVEVKSAIKSQTGEFSLDTKQKLKKGTEERIGKLIAARVLEFVDSVVRDRTQWTPEQRKRILTSLFKTIITCQREELKGHPFDNLEFDCIDTKN